MTVNVVALVTLNDDEPYALAKYLEATTPLLEQVGAKILHRMAIGETIVGVAPAKSMILVEYPSREAVKSLFESDAYQQIVPMRDRAFSYYHVSIVDN